MINARGGGDNEGSDADRVKPTQALLFFLEARIVAGDTLGVLKLVKLYPVPFISRVCDQFCACKFVECDQLSLTFDHGIVYRKDLPF